MITIIKRILGQFRNDRRSLMLLLVAPLFVLSLLYFILGDSNYIPKVTVFHINQPIQTILAEKCSVTEITDLSELSEMSKLSEMSELSEILKSTEISEMSELSELKSYMESSGMDAFIWSDENEIHIYMLDKNSKNGKVLKILQKAMKSELSVEYEYTTNEENQLDSMSFVFIGMISFTFVFILSGMSFVRERTNQTLERMLMAPLGRAEVIGGYILGYGMLSALQSVLIILFSVYVLKLEFRGSVLLCILIMIAMSFAAVSVGSLISIFADNELQLVQFIPVVLIPQIFFSGLIPLDTIPYGLGNLKYFTAAYYGCSTLQQVIIFGKGITDIWVTILELLAFIGILFVLNVAALKKYRRI